EIHDAGTAGARATKLRVVVPEGEGAIAEEAGRELASVLPPLEEYFARPYPFEKLDLVAVPEFPGAMENAGMITWNLDSLAGAPGADPRDQLRYRLDTIAHEAAHQW